MNPLKISLLCIIALSSAPPKTDADSRASKEQTRSKAPATAVEAWKDMRYGMFIHWGPVALTGHEISWSRGKQTPIKEYDDLYKRFNPEQFDAEEWVDLAKTAGMKYIVLTTKHHDGFCLWPSEYTDYDIETTPFKRDIVGELAVACRKAGMGFGTYYSVCDWIHRDYPKGGVAGSLDKPDSNLEKYIEYMQQQTTELVKKYGPLTTMWFDVPREVEWQHNEPTIEMLRALQPDILINNRAYVGDNVADYDTPEQNLGAFDRERPWETCMTIAKQWAWKPNDPVKSLEQCLHGLLYSIGGDGNFLFNIGPDATGRIEPEQVKRLKEMGAWIQPYEQAVYGTRGGPVKPSGWGASTHRDLHIYLFIARWPKNGPLQLPLKDVQIIDAENLSGNEVHFATTPHGYMLSVPAAQRDSIATVIKLTVDTPADKIKPIAMESVSGSLAYNKSGTASSARWTKKKFPGPHQQAFDDNPGSHWIPGAAEDEAWVAVDLGRPHTVNTLQTIQYESLIKQLSLQYKDKGEWITLCTEKDVSDDLRKTFKPVTAQHFRLLLQGTKNSHIYLSEFQLFNIQSD